MKGMYLRRFRALDRSNSLGVLDHFVGDAEVAGGGQG